MTKTFSLEYTKEKAYQTPEQGDCSIGVIIVAAGSASRMAGVNKITAKLCGEPVIVRTLRAFDCINEIKSIVLVTRPDLVCDLQNIVARAEISKVTDIVPGGSCRAASVKNGFEVLKKDSEIKTVLIHDGARPLVSEKVIRNVITAAEEFSAAIPVVPVKDTIKRVGALGRVEDTPDRTKLVSVQTPQGFSAQCYQSALDKAGDSVDAFTDDSALVESAGFTVYTVEGDYKNLKITTPEDMAVAEALLRLEWGQEKCE